MHKHHLNM